MDRSETRSAVREQAKAISIAITQPINDQNLNYVGVVPKKTLPARPAPVGGLWQKVWAISKEQPGHFAKNWVSAIPSFIAVSAVYIWFALSLKIYTKNVILPPLDTERFLFYWYPSSLYTRTPWIGFYGPMGSFFSMALWTICWYVSLGTMWNRRILFRTTFVFLNLLTSVGGFILIYTPVVFSKAPSVGWTVLAYMALFTTSAAVTYHSTVLQTFISHGLATDNLPWAILGMVPISGIAVQAILYDLMFATALLTLGDIPKMLFVIVLHPLYSEASGLCARLASRTVRHNHPTTTFHLVSYTVTVKKIYTRLVIMTMTARWMTFISIFLAFLELTLRVTMPYRDRFFYRKVFGPHLDGKSPFKTMTDARNRTLRAETESVENVSDFVFIFAGVLWAWLGRISFNGTTVATLQGLLSNAAVQFLIECSLDIGVAYFIGILQNYYTFQHAANKTPFWGFVVATHCLGPTFAMVSMTLPYALCRARDEAFDWTVCS